MGANHSQSDSNPYPSHDLTKNGKKPHHHKGASVGHNSGCTVFAYTVELTTPDKNKDKEWTTLTKSCQGNSYQVKNLTPNSEYIFRVRAENIHGVSKPSRPSDPVQTKMYEMDDKTYGTSSSDDRLKNAPKRRHSFNLHLDGAVTTILNHTDIDVKPHAASVSETDRERETSRISTLQRDAAARSSLQPNRKRSLPILLPGTRTNSMMKLRDSQALPNSDSIESLSSRKGRNAGSTSRPRSDAKSDTSSEGKLDEVEGKSDGKSDKNESSTDGDDSKDRSQELKKVGSEDDLNSDPWERDDSVSGVSDRIMSAPLCDDMKLALYSRSVPEGTSPNSTWISRNMHQEGTSEEGQADFRTLRSLLHSDDIIVKPTAARSLPDVTGCSAGVKKLSVQRNNNNNNYAKLSTIVDLEEDEESVRITTL
nr:hypothetical protein BaRGS_000296 [Batillaria attramentaria]